MEAVILHELGSRAVRKFGWNPHGKPLYRVVRADTRREWRMGEYRPKYPQYGACWVLETWVAPDKYGTPEEWYAAKDDNGQCRLGPYPAQGDYEMVYPMLANDDAYNPNEDICQFLVTAAEKSKGLTRSDRWAHIQAEKAAARESRMKQLRDLIDDARPMRGSVAVAKHIEALTSTAPSPAQPAGASMRTGE